MKKQQMLAANAATAMAPRMAANAADPVLNTAKHTVKATMLATLRTNPTALRASLPPSAAGRELVVPMTAVLTDSPTG
jgi:hypothetical protein